MYFYQTSHSPYYCQLAGAVLIVSRSRQNSDRVTGWRRHPQAGAAGWCGTNLFEISPKFCPKITGWRLNPHGSVHGEQDRTIDVAGRDPSTPRIHTPSLCLVHPQMTPSIRTYCVSIIAAKNTLLMEKPSNDQLETLRRLRLSTRVRCRRWRGRQTRVYARTNRQA
jgi:hypothetical protein